MQLAWLRRQQVMQQQAQLGKVHNTLCTAAACLGCLASAQLQHAGVTQARWEEGGTGGGQQAGRRAGRGLHATSAIASQARVWLQFAAPHAHVAYLDHEGGRRAVAACKHRAVCELALVVHTNAVSCIREVTSCNTLMKTLCTWWSWKQRSRERRKQYWRGSAVGTHLPEPACQSPWRCRTT